MKTGNSDNRNPEYILTDTQTVDKNLDNEHDINLGFSSVYGKCYDENSYMNGTKLNSSIINSIHYMMSCAETLDPAELTRCSQESVQQGLPIVKRRPNDIDDTKIQHLKIIGTILL